MNLADSRFLPDASLEHDEMLALQREIAETARFADDLAFDPTDLVLASPEAEAGSSIAHDEPEDHDAESGYSNAPVDQPVLVGVDQAFRDDEVVSAAVAYRGPEILERVTAAVPLELPYIPGLLAFREAGGIVSALEALEASPDCVLVDGSGRIHYRQAGLATHVGVLFDVPAVGVAKSLLCGEPDCRLDEPLDAGERVAIRADDGVEVPEGTTLGYAVQTRQFETGDRYVNPLYVSPGHHVGAETAADVVLATGDGYKLPEPIRAADRLAGEVARAENPAGTE